VKWIEITDDTQIPNNGQYFLALSAFGSGESPDLCQYNEMTGVYVCLGRNYTGSNCVSYSAEKIKYWYKYILPITLQKDNI
jgi:hypothetical protein